MTTSTTASVWQAERARRLSILTRLLYVCGGVVLALLVLLLILTGGVTAQNQITLAELAGLFVAICVAWGLARTRMLNPAAHLLFVALVAATLATSLPSGTNSGAIYTLFIPIVGATLLLSPFWSLGYAGLALLTYVAIYLIGQNPVNKTPLGLLFNVVLFGGYFGIVALLSFLAARGYEQQIQVGLTHAENLERARAELEERVAERTRDLSGALEDVRRSAETIQQMSVPVLPIADGVLVLPLVGALDSQRAVLLTERLLDTIQRERAHMVLIDITGVPVVDTQVAGALIRASQAVQLLGAEPVICGIRAEVAQTVVGLGLDLGRLTSQRDLRSGLAYALSKAGDYQHQI
jgi:anti-anti-sigma regulatory factor